MLKVLIVDDDRNLCKCLLELIPWRELQCETPRVAYNGLEALEIMKNHPIDFMVCDLRMPAMDGAELSKIVRKEYPETKIVFLSAYEDFDTARQALLYGITDYILKPLNRDSLESLKKHIRSAAAANDTREYEKRLFGGEYNEGIFEALYNKNREYIEDVILHLKLLEEAAITNGCIYLLHILYEYLFLLRQGEEQERYDTISRKACHEVMDMATPEERIEFVRTRFLSEITEKTVSDFNIVIYRIKELVKEAYCNENCNVSWLADKLHLSAPYIGRIFSRQEGTGLSEYITDIRMKKACDLLRQDVLTINEIAAKIGYADANYFTKVFKNKMNIPPSDYRKQYCMMKGDLT